MVKTLNLTKIMKTENEIEVLAGQDIKKELNDKKNKKIKRTIKNK